MNDEIEEVSNDLMDAIDNAIAKPMRAKDALAVLEDLVDRIETSIVGLKEDIAREK